VSVFENIQKLQTEIHELAVKCNRSSQNIHVVAVSKYARKEQIIEAQKAGLEIFGESRPQQLEERAEWYRGARVDMIGRLQRNKVKKIMPIVNKIHSVDSVKLAKEINKVAMQYDKKQEIFLQINIAEEKQKQGFLVQEIFKEIEKIRMFQNLSIVGLMTMAPQYVTEKEKHDVFRKLAILRDKLQNKYSGIQSLSMGMSNDYKQAVLAGATHIRIGTAIFEETKRK